MRCVVTQKTMFSAADYAKKYRRIDFYRPNPKQLEFHNKHADCNGAGAARAGTQMGKTHAGAAQMTMDSLALYPDWYHGRKFLCPAAAGARRRFHRVGCFC